jgi:hypothetical protein
MHYCSNLDENNKEQGTYIMHVDFLLLEAGGLPAAPPARVK